MRSVCVAFQTQISYHGSEDGGESEDSEGENQELAQIDRGVFVYENFFLFSLGTTSKHILECVAYRLIKDYFHFDLS